MADTIRRIASRTAGFVIIGNEALRRSDLSARAKGVYAYLMTLPNDWKLSRDELGNHFTEGRDALNTAFAELTAAGYITRVEVRDAGRFVAVEYTIHEEPVAPSTEKPLTVKPLTENPQLLSTERKLSTKVLKKNLPTLEDHVLDYLNTRTKSRFRTYKGTGLTGLVKQGHTLDDFMAVIDNRISAWGTDKKMSQYLTPSTLFSAANFDKYWNAATKERPKSGTEVDLSRPAYEEQSI